MPGADRPERIVNLTDAPTAEEEHAIGSGLARFRSSRAGSATIGRWRWSSATLTPSSQSAASPAGPRSASCSSTSSSFPTTYGATDSVVACCGSRRTRGGCVNAVLYTINFQAPGFYERHGYRVIGTVPCLPPGTSRIFMTKPLT